MDSKGAATVFLDCDSFGTAPTLGRILAYGLADLRCFCWLDRVTLADLVRELQHRLRLCDCPHPGGLATWLLMSETTRRQLNDGSDLDLRLSGVIVVIVLIMYERSKRG